MKISMNRNDELRFYPKHPSDSKTYTIETTEMQALRQDVPFEVKEIYDEFIADSDSFFDKYTDKRFEVTGIAVKVGADIHNKPSIELSDCAGGETYALVIFPTNEHYSKVKVGDRVVVRANYLVMCNHYGTVMKYSELIDVKKNEAQEQLILNYPFFDGKNVVENSSVVVEKGIISKITVAENTDDRYFLMPGLIDAHTHMGTNEQIQTMLKYGVAGTCDVAAPQSLVQSSKDFVIVSSAGMTMGTLSGKGYVKKAIADGARYIKVLLMEPGLMLSGVLKDICRTAHDNGIKVAAHAVSVKAVELAVKCGVDILIHVPAREKYPEELAEAIAQKGIVVAPTLVMMERFTNSGQFGYVPDNYQNAENAVRLLHKNNVKLLAATDANESPFSLPMTYGDSMHRELKLLVKAGLTPEEALAAATGNVAEVFEQQNIGAIEEGKPATLLLVEGRPDKNIEDSVKIKKMWINGKIIDL